MSDFQSPTLHYNFFELKYLKKWKMLIVLYNKLQTFQSDIIDDLKTGTEIRPRLTDKSGCMRGFPPKSLL